MSIGCPSCRSKVDNLRASPRVVRDGRPLRAQVVAVYPCGCWLDPARAVGLAAQLQAARAEPGP